MDKKQYKDILVSEDWSPSAKLRYVERLLRQDDSCTSKVLQQLHKSSLGNKKWVDVPIEREF